MKKLEKSYSYFGILFIGLNVTSQLILLERIQRIRTCFLPKTF